MKEKHFRWEGNHSSLRNNILALLENYSVFCYLDSNNFYSQTTADASPQYHTYDLLVGGGAKDQIFSSPKGKNFEALSHWLNNEWCFGHLAYDLKNDLEALSSKNEDNQQFDDLHFFIPEWVIALKKNDLIIYGPNQSTIEQLYQNIQTECETRKNKNSQSVRFYNNLPRKEYISRANSLIQEIIDGNVYEVNFCQEFYAEKTRLNPFSLFKDLMKTSPTPFACFYRYHEHYVISASMERFLKKTGRKLISQPIKGTIKRGQTPEKDKALKEALRNNDKERAENVMIVDLVRNDLAKSAIPGSVQVEELFGIYPFPAVHQMISTVTAEMTDQTDTIEAIKNAFPMGSMTGAPKVSAMTLIEKYENFKRGIFSGAIGYITPWGDFDFNVIIRSFLYNADNQYVSIPVGSAITFDANPEEEFEECNVKIDKLKRALKSN